MFILQTDIDYFLEQLGAGTGIIKMKLTSKFPTT